jgi:hypothetical protein
MSVRNVSRMERLIGEPAIFFTHEMKMINARIVGESHDATRVAGGLGFGAGPEADDALGLLLDLDGFLVDRPIQASVVMRGGDDGS